MKILDYIFYRLYNAYAKKDNSPVFSSICVMSAQIFVLVSPIIGMLYELIKNESTTIPKVLVVSIIGFIMLLLRHRYGNKVIRNKILYGIRKKSKWDKLPDIFFYLFLTILSVVIGIGLFIIIKKAVIDTYNLEGIVWRLISQ